MREWRLTPQMRRDDIIRRRAEFPVRSIPYFHSMPLASAHSSVSGHVAAESAGSASNEASALSFSASLSRYKAARLS